jgi:hypothetical protein
LQPVRIKPNRMKILRLSPAFAIFCKPNFL